MSDHVLVLTTLPEQAIAMQIAEALVEEGLAACVSVLPAMTSVYRWQGQRQVDTEHQLLIKTRAARFSELESFLRKHHPYELPEIIALPIRMGSADYLAWIDENTRR